MAKCLTNESTKARRSVRRPTGFVEFDIEILIYNICVSDDDLLVQSHQELKHLIAQVVESLQADLAGLGP